MNKPLDISEKIQLRGLLEAYYQEAQERRRTILQLKVADVLYEVKCDICGCGAKAGQPAC